MLMYKVIFWADQEDGTYRLSDVIETDMSNEDYRMFNASTPCWVVMAKETMDTNEHVFVALSLDYNALISFVHGVNFAKKMHNIEYWDKIKPINQSRNNNDEETQDDTT